MSTNYPTLRPYQLDPLARVAEALRAGRPAPRIVLTRNHHARN